MWLDYDLPNIELLKMLPITIQQTYASGSQPPAVEEDTNFSAKSFRKSLQQAVTGQTLLLSQMWEELTLTDDNLLVKIQLIPEFQRKLKDLAKKYRQFYTDLPLSLEQL